MLLCFIFNSLTLLFYEWNRIGFVVLGGDGVAILPWSRELVISIARSGFDGDLMCVGVVRRGRGLWLGMAVPPWGWAECELRRAFGSFET